MTPLVASLLILALSPLLYRLGRSFSPWLAFLDGFTFVAITGLILFEVLPEAFDLAGLWAFPVALLGFLGPAVAERFWKVGGRRVHSTALFLALSGLLAHGFIDGIALVDRSTPLPLVVILHRLPVALTIWWLLRPTHGRAIAIGALAALGLATVAGAQFGDQITTDSITLGLFQALVSGSLLHVLIHVTAPFQKGTVTHSLPAGVGALASLVLLGMLAGFFGPHDHSAAAGSAAGVPGHESEHFSTLFFALVLKSAPALLIGYAAAGLVHAFLPKASLVWMRRGSRLRQSVKGVIFGLPLPICSCGVLPVYRSLILNRVPMAAAASLLVAAPELGFDAVLLSFPLLGAEMTAARVLSAGIVAILVGWIMSRWSPLPSAGAIDPVVAPSASARTLPGRLREAVKMGLGEMVDGTAPWILVGLAVAALADPVLEAEWIQGVPAGWEVIFFALLGAPIYVCASGATPLVAVLVAHGVSPGAGLAFLLTGPATNVTTFGILSQLHGRNTAFLFAGAMLTSAVAAGHVTNLVIPELALELAPAQHAAHPAAVVCAILLAILFGLSVLRQGPRGFVKQVLSTAGASDHTHNPGASPDPCCGEPASA